MTPATEPTPPGRGLARRFAKELRGWVLGAIGAVPIVVAFTIVEPRLPAALQGPAFMVITMAPFLIIGLLSRSTLWVLIVWLAPIVALDVALLVGAGGVVLLIGWILAMFWVVTREVLPKQASFRAWRVTHANSPYPAGHPSGVIRAHSRSRAGRPPRSRPVPFREKGSF